jgi:hypothetical protein
VFVQSPKSQTQESALSYELHEASFSHPPDSSFETLQDSAGEGPFRQGQSRNAGLCEDLHHQVGDKKTPGIYLIISEADTLYLNVYGNKM